MPQLIIIEGNIGVGKSTLTKNLAEAFNAVPMLEPVETNPYLERFYEDKKRWALEMQFWLMSHRFAAHQEAIQTIWKTGQSVIMDRSIYGDSIFAETLLDDGCIDQFGYKSYCNMRDVMFRFLMIPQISIFLHAHPEICLNRIKERSRGCEISISVAYLTKLEWFYKKLRSHLIQLGSNVIDIDYNKIANFIDITKILNSHIFNFNNYKKIN